MTVRIDDDARFPIYWDADLTFDPTSSTVRLDVDGTPHDMTWLGTAVEVVTGRQWTRTARTDARFCGTAITPTGTDVALSAGRHVGEPVVTTTDGQLVPCYPTIFIDSH